MLVWESHKASDIHELHRALQMIADIAKTCNARGELEDAVKVQLLSRRLTDGSKVYDIRIIEV